MLGKVKQQKIYTFFFKYYPIGITVTILAAFPAFLEKRNSTAVARVAMAVTGAIVPICSSLRQGQAAEENKAHNGNLHLGIFLGMEARNAEKKKYIKNINK
jgi:hypothetical protein